MSRIARLTRDGAGIAAYPLDTHDLRRLASHVSLPLEPSDEQLGRLGYARVHNSARPQAPLGGHVVEETPVRDAEGRWVRAWRVEEPTTEVITRRKESMKEDLLGKARQRLPLTAPLQAAVDDARSAIDAAGTLEEAQAVSEAF